MKKYILPALLSMALFSCSNSMEDLAEPDISHYSKMKASEVYIYSGSTPLGQTKGIYDKKEELGYSIPKDGKFDVWYYIRIDGKIPGEPINNNTADQYFPQTTTGKTVISDLNHGTVNANVEWRTSDTKKFPKYVFSTDATGVQSIIVDEPTLDELFAANQGTKYDLSGYIEHKDELHFLWYACKQQSADHIWHVDGILTSKDRTDISQTIYGNDQIKNYTDAGMVIDNKDVSRKGYIEIDVHQQQHTDWNEIKTSIHMRDTAAVEVFLPIDYQAQADDFDIRIGEEFKYITEYKNASITIGDTTYDVAVTIKHEAEGIRIQIQPNKEALIAARKLYDDGITFEVHSYVTSDVTNQFIWDRLKTTTCTDDPYTTIIGQITSAYYDEKVEL